MKAVLFVGLHVKYFSTNWTLKFGNSSDPFENTSIYTAGNDAYKDWAKEVSVNSSGRYMVIVKNNFDPELWIGYIAVFLECLNCSGSKIAD